MVVGEMLRRLVGEEASWADGEDGGFHAASNEATRSPGVAGSFPSQAVSE